MLHFISTFILQPFKYVFNPSQGVGTDKTNNTMNLSQNVYIQGFSDFSDSTM